MLFGSAFFGPRGLVGLSMFAATVLASSPALANGTPADQPFVSGPIVAMGNLEVPKANLRPWVDFKINIPVPDGTFDHPLNWLAAINPTDQADLVLQKKDMIFGPTGQPQVVQLTGRIEVPSSYQEGERLYFPIRAITFTSVAEKNKKLAAIPFSPLGNSLFEKRIYLLIKDAWGYYYLRDILLAPWTTLQHQSSSAQIKTYGILEPLGPGTKSLPAYPNLLGVTAEFEVRTAASNVVKMNLMFHNGGAGADDSNPLDDPVGNFFFESIHLLIPQQVQVRPMFKTKYSDYEIKFSDPADLVKHLAFFPTNPLQGMPSHMEKFLTEELLLTHMAYPIAEKRSDGKMHFMPAFAQFDIYTALTDFSEDPSGEIAREYARGAGQAFVIHEPGLWSWWSPATTMPGRYLPQRMRLPDYTYITGEIEGSRNSIKEFEEDQLSFQEGLYENDQSHDGIYYSEGDWLKKEGVAYGGGTGGTDIGTTKAEGIRLAWSGSRAGLLNLMLRFKGHKNRQPNALYKLDGKPGRVADYMKFSYTGELHADGNFFTRPSPEYSFPKCDDSAVPLFCEELSPFFPYTVVPDSGPGGTHPYKEDKYGYHLMNQTQALEVILNKRYSPSTLSEENIWGTVTNWGAVSYAPIDAQHLIRYSGFPITLAWLTGFYPAIHALEMAAANVEHEYTYINMDGTWEGSTNMKPDIEFAKDFPQHGTSFGRGEAWQLYAMNAYYSMADQGFRDSVAEWYTRLADMLFQAQIPCTGLVYRDYNPGKFFILGGASQYFEEQLAHHAFAGLYQSTLVGTGHPYEIPFLDLVRKSLQAVYRDYNWNHDPAIMAPYKYVAIDPIDPTSGTSDPIGPAYCEKTVPKDLDCDASIWPDTCDGTPGIYEAYYVQNSLALSLWYQDDLIETYVALCHLEKLSGGFQEMTDALFDFQHDPWGITPDDNLGNKALAMVAYQAYLPIIQALGHSSFCF